MSAQAGRKALRTASDKRTKQQNETLQEIKNRTLCSVCGESGHWHTNPACKKYEETMRRKDAERRAPKAGASSKSKAKAGFKRVDSKSGSKKLHEVGIVASSPSGAAGATSVAPVPTESHLPPQLSSSSTERQLEFFCRYKEPNPCCVVNNGNGSRMSPHIVRMVGYALSSDSDDDLLDETGNEYERAFDISTGLYCTPAA